jgi:hypothetical protein
MLLRYLIPSDRLTPAEEPYVAAPEMYASR